MLVGARVGQLPNFRSCATVLFCQPNNNFHQRQNKHGESFGKKQIVEYKSFCVYVYICVRDVHAKSQPLVVDGTQISIRSCSSQRSQWVAWFFHLTCKTRGISNFSKCLAKLHLKYCRMVSDATLPTSNILAERVLTSDTSLQQRASTETDTPVIANRVQGVIQPNTEACLTLACHCSQHKDLFLTDGLIHFLAPVLHKLPILLRPPTDFPLRDDRQLSL